MATWRSSGSQSGWTGIDSKEHNPSCQFVPDRSILVRESSRYVRPLRRGTGWWLCSSGSTSLEGNHPISYKGDIWRGMISSMGSSTSHPPSRRNRTQFAFSSRESSRRASHLPLTKRGEQCHRECGRNLAEGQTSGARSVVGCAQCKFLHREESTPCPQISVCFTMKSCAANSLSLRHAELSLSRCPAPILGCYQVFLATKIVQLPPSCAQSCPVPEPEPSPIVMVRVQHRIPYKHVSVSSVSVVAV